jgi:hypothetical protein
MDGMARMGLAGKYNGIYTLSSARQVELAKHRRRRSGWNCLQPSLSSATRSTIADCSEHCTWSHHLWFSQLGRRASLSTLEAQAGQKAIASGFSYRESSQGCDTLAIRIVFMVRRQSSHPEGLLTGTGASSHSCQRQV